ncbi:hypothetical protein ABT336_12195 [Micromonospora sp. NPDC000207]|uniref:hypothetical protein n=1 Tax=Micromonospora sp. NPDC000207 TaxID=3154246 RepID=UPI003318C4D5
MTAARPPVWLLDVDGVINASKPGWSAPPRTAYAYAQGQQWKMRWAPALITRIRDLHNNGIVEVRWCTTWCAYADQLERLWALPPLGRAFTDDVNGHAASVAKLAAVRQVLTEGRRLIWTDDTEVPLGGPLYDELMADVRVLLCRPKASRGLQPIEVDDIEAFATKEQPVTDPSALYHTLVRLAAINATTVTLVIPASNFEQVTLARDNINIPLWLLDEKPGYRFFAQVNIYAERPEHIMLWNCERDSVAAA